MKTKWIDTLASNESTKERKETHPKHFQYKCVFSGHPIEKSLLMYFAYLRIQGWKYKESTLWTQNFSSWCPSTQLMNSSFYIVLYPAVTPKQWDVYEHVGQWSVAHQCTHKGSPPHLWISAHCQNTGHPSFGNRRKFLGVNQTLWLLCVGHSFYEGVLGAISPQKTSELTPV